MKTEHYKGHLITRSASGDWWALGKRYSTLARAKADIDLIEP